MLLPALTIPASYAKTKNYAATAKKVIGTVTVQRGTELIKLKRGAKLYQGDTIQTSAKGRVMIIFRDKTKFVLGRNASMKVNRFSYAKKKKDNMFISVLKGSFRFVSGIMAKKRHRSMQVKVGRKLATIGIRGTHVAGEVIGDSSDIMLLEPEKEEQQIISEAKQELKQQVQQSIDGITEQEAEAAILAMDTPSEIKVENEFGSVIIDKAGYGTNIPDAFSPPSPMRRMKLRTINNLMRSMQRARRMHRF